MGKAEETSKVTLTSLQSRRRHPSLIISTAQRTYRDALRIFNQALFDERMSLYELASAIGLGVE